MFALLYDENYRSSLVTKVALYLEIKYTITVFILCKLCTNKNIKKIKPYKFEQLEFLIFSLFWKLSYVKVYQNNYFAEGLEVLLVYTLIGKIRMFLTLLNFCKLFINVHIFISTVFEIE